MYLNLQIIYFYQLKSHFSTLCLIFYINCNKNNYKSQDYFFTFYEYRFLLLQSYITTILIKFILQTSQFPFHLVILYQLIVIIKKIDHQARYFNGKQLNNIKNTQGECRQVDDGKLIQIRSDGNNFIHKIEKIMNEHKLYNNKQNNILIIQLILFPYFIHIIQVISCFYQDLSQQTSISILYYSMRLFMKNHQIQLNYEKKNVLNSQY
ncbi:hypothetical protein pb186bvf_014273 [Paramecium bursaria]